MDKYGWLQLWSWRGFVNFENYDVMVTIAIVIPI